ncbi:hypothetical protein CYG49_04510 [Candidatus Saccharibacteria bacterium]|nr:MAG: hypothetical protein CYG49_04510 [Candidatus Saccharibacteria bacterium]
MPTAFPDFPRTDIDAKTASHLGLILGSADIRDQFHAVAEQIHSGFRSTHLTLLAEVAGQLYPYDEFARRRFELGVVAFEAMHPMVVATTIGDGSLHAGLEAKSFGTNRDETVRLLDAHQDDLEVFCEELPNTVIALSEASERFVDPTNRTHMLLGASSLRSVILAA